MFHREVTASDLSDAVLLDLLASRTRIIGAFLAALLGAIASGYALPTSGIPVDNPPGWSEALWPVPGSLIALAASYSYGARLERGAGEDDR